MARWLKVAVDTPYKQAIRNAARDCGCSRGDAFLAFFELYSWLDEQTDDGRLATDRAELDRWAGIPGFAESLTRSGWLTFRGDICEITNWASITANVQSAGLSKLKGKTPFVKNAESKACPSAQCQKCQQGGEYAFNAYEVRTH